jgi:hypothetical protein
MKYILILLLAPLALFGQQDSVVYKKFKNGGTTTLSIELPTTSMFTLDSGYYKLRFSVNSGSLVISIDPFTDIDSLMGNVLFNEFTDASRQYKAAILVSESTEKGYELRLRQAEKQYEEFTKEKIKDRIEKEFDPKELIGDWELNGKPVKIDDKLLLDKKPIKVLSDEQFVIEINNEKIIFNRIKPDYWVSKGEKYTLKRTKVKGKKK